MFFLDASRLDHIFLEKSFGRTLEHLYFFTNPDQSLITNTNYSEQYKNYLLEKFGIKQQISAVSAKEHQYNFWINQGIDIEHTKLLNSKINLKNILKNLDIDNGPWFQFPIDCDKGEVIEKYDHWLLKMDQSFSGRGSKIITSKKLKNLKENAQFKHYIAEPYYKKLMDFSMLSDGENRFFYKTEVGHQFEIKKIHLRHESDFSRFICKNLPDNQSSLSSKIKDFEKKLELIEQYLKGIYPRSVFSLDSMVVVDKNSVKFVIAELNFRKTLGYFGMSIKNRYFTDSASIIMHIDYKRNKDHLCIPDRKGFILLSPKESPIQLSVIDDH